MKLFKALMLILSVSPLTFAQGSYLGATMEVLGKDLKIVSAPANSPTPNQVTDSMILGAIIRTRTCASQLQLVHDRAEGEMLPSTIATLPPAERAVKVAEFRELILLVKNQITALEPLLKDQLDRPLETRDFRSVKEGLGAVGQTIQQGHNLFKPDQP